MKKSFGVCKFKGLLLAGSFTVLANYIVRLSDSIIAGKMLGEDAFAGVNLAGPCLSAISFLSALIATGMATNYSIAMGKCDCRRAREIGTQALWTIAIFGGILASLIFFGREAFLEFFHASGKVSHYANEYLSWIWPVAILEGLVAMLVALSYADGDAKLSAIAYVVLFVGNFITSIIGVKLGMECAGCALGSIVACSLSVMVLSLHFFRKSNTFKIVPHFSIKDSFGVFTASFGDAAAFLCDGILFFFLNKFIILNFGSSLLPVVGVATALWGFLEFFNGIGVAIQPIVTVYYGEGNTKSLRRVMKSAINIAILEGIAFMEIFGYFPELITNLVGINDSALILESSKAIRFMSCGFVALAFAGLFNSYYMFIEKSALAVAVTFFCYLVMPVVCVTIGSFAGVKGVWAGMGLGPFVGILVVAIIVISNSGWQSFPLLIPRNRDNKLHVFDLELSDVEIAMTSAGIGEALEKAKVNESIVMRASLMTEEVLMAVRDRNHNRNVLAEVTLDLNDGVQLTLRDDGEIFDITDADAQISSLRSFLVASMMQHHNGRLNLVTTGFNRNVFRF